MIFACCGENIRVVRDSGHRSQVQELLYGFASPVYDAFARWAFWPLGGENAFRAQVARWLHAEPGHEVVSLCCGTGSTDRALLESSPSLRITGVDLGRSQLARARRKDLQARIDYRLGDATDTGLDADRFDRALIVGALQEMPRARRVAVLGEARRICRNDARLLAVEPGPTASRATSFARAAWLLHWVPGNPEVATTRELLAGSLPGDLATAGWAPIARETTRPDWFEAVLAKPV